MHGTIKDGDGTMHWWHWVRTRAPEGIPALAEGLRDRNPETRLAALRGLGQMACPEAAVEILNWVGEAGLVVPALPLQKRAGPNLRRTSASIVALPAACGASVRGSASTRTGRGGNAFAGSGGIAVCRGYSARTASGGARALSYMEPGLAVNVLSELARDPIMVCAPARDREFWEGLATEAELRFIARIKRFESTVRLRAAEALVDLEIEMVPIFER